MTRIQRFSIVPICALFLAGCSTTPINPNPSPTLIPVEDSTTSMSADEIEAAYDNGEAVACTIQKGQDSQPIQAITQRNRVRMTHVNLGSGKTSGIVVSDGVVFYIWEEGSAIGFKSQIPSKEQLAVLLQKTDSLGMSIPNLSSSQSISTLSNEGYSVDCVRTQIAEDTFVPASYVVYTDITGTVEESLQGM